MSSKREAKKAVDAISETYGFIDDEMWAKIEQWNPNFRRTLERKMHTKDELAAGAIGA